MKTMLSRSQDTHIRLFGSPSCEDCRAVRQFLSQNGINYYYVNALDISNESICDQNNVFELPHLQVINKNQNITYETIGDLTLKDKKEILRLAKIDR